jgi:hypothetical protein
MQNFKVIAALLGLWAIQASADIEDLPPLTESASEIHEILKECQATRQEISGKVIKEAFQMKLEARSATRMRVKPSHENMYFGFKIRETDPKNPVTYRKAYRVNFSDDDGRFWRVAVVDCDPRTAYRYSTPPKSS